MQIYNIINYKYKKTILSGQRCRKFCKRIFNEWVFILYISDYFFIIYKLQIFRGEDLFYN